MQPFLCSSYQKEKGGEAYTGEMNEIKPESSVLPCLSWQEFSISFISIPTVFIGCQLTKPTVFCPAHERSLMRGNGLSN